MNIHKLLSSKERVKILSDILCRTDYLTVSKTAKELNLSKALISQFFAMLKKEGILSRNNKVKGTLEVKALKIALNLNSIDTKVFNKPFIKAVGLYGSPRLTSCSRPTGKHISIFPSGQRWSVMTKNFPFR